MNHCRVTSIYSKISKGIKKIRIFDSYAFYYSRNHQFIHGKNNDKIHCMLSQLFEF